MQQTTGSKWMWLLDAGVASLVPTLVMWHLLGWLAEDQCLDRGGRVRGGVEAFCELPGGRLAPLSLDLTSFGGLVLAVLWLGMAAAIYWCARRWLRRMDYTKHR